MSDSGKKAKRADSGDSDSRHSLQLDWPDTARNRKKTVNNKQINIKCKVSEHPGQRRRSSKGPEEARPKPPATPSSFIIVGHHGITTGKSNSARRSSSPRRPLPNGAIPKSPRSRNTHKSLPHSPSQPGSFRDVHEFPQGEKENTELYTISLIRDMVITHKGHFFSLDSLMEKILDSTLTELATNAWCWKAMN